MMQNGITILLVGLGQLGSRYLQGLNFLSHNFQVDIIEPSSEAFSIGLNVAGVEKNTFVTTRRIELIDLKKSYTVIIVATSSKPRADMVEKLAERTSAKGWILEKVLACSIEELERIKKALSKQNAWVNTPRRITSLYRSLLGKLGDRVLSFEVKIPGFAMACNSIHFIDAVSWLSGSKLLRVQVATEDGWFESKRVGYFEFDGYLRAFFENGSELVVDNSDSNEQQLGVTTKDNKLYIDEGEGIYSDEELIHGGRLELQSELSGRLFNSIENNDFFEFLPTLEESIHQHKLFFDALASNRQLSLKRDNYWAIT